MEMMYDGLACERDGEDEEMYSINRIVSEIGYDITYLVDAPDEKLVPYLETLDILGERLRELREWIAKKAVI